MSFRFRKSVKVAPGVKVNLGKKSASVTVGGKLFRETVSTTGKTTHSVSIPGTGIYATKTVSGSHNKVNHENYASEYSYSEELNDEVAVEKARKWLKTQTTCKSANLAADLRIPFSQAERIVDCFEKDGLVGPFRGAQGREIFKVEL